MNLIKFGEIIPNLKIDGKDAPYPVLNERDTRAAAGIMLIFGGVAFANAFLAKEYTYINLIVILFLIEFSLRQINPYIAPFYAIGKLLVKNQRTEWVGAAQKRFAWALGLLMALTMTFIIYVLELRGLSNLLICLVCLLLLWSESSLGVCIGCKIYYKLIDFELISKPKVAPACPGGVCSINKNR